MSLVPCHSSEIVHSARSGASVWAGSQSTFAGTVEILPLGQALKRLKPEWAVLEAASESPSVFQSAGWAETVLAWRTKTPGGSIREFQVLTAYDRHGRLVGLWPIQFERRLGVVFAVGLGDPFNQYSDVLVHSGAERDSVVTAMLEALCALGTVSGVLMRKVRTDAAANSCLSVRGFSTGDSGAAPMVDLRPYGDFAAYHGTVKSKTRKNLRNARNRLERSGVPLEHKVYDTAEDIAAVLERSFALRAAWLEQEGLTSRAFLDSGFARFVRDVGAAHGTSLDLLAFELRQGADMLSIQWGFVHNKRYYAFIAARNPAFDAQSPGRLHLEDVIRSCAERGIEVVDFLAPDVDYKRTWATESVAIQDYAVAFNLRGRLVLGGLFETLRRFCKAAFAWMPNGVRQLVIRVAARIR
ncbi:MAG: GNAT family N-acetyltransferase [Hyphomicrobiaceae bacterium]